MLELNTQTREDKRKWKVKLTQKVDKITYINNFERRIQELYQTSDDSEIPSKLDSTLIPELLTYSRKVRENELQWCVLQVMDGGSIYSLPRLVLSR